MKTEITKAYNWGFVLTEQDLRRTAQVALDSLVKISNALPQHFFAKIKLKDGSIVDTAGFEDIFALENSGEKSIYSVALHWELCGENVDPMEMIELEFMNGAKNKKNWNSISYRVLGTTRDWAFVTASEIDERVKRTKQIAWESIFAEKWLYMIITLLAMFIAVMATVYFMPKDQYHVTLEKLYKAGEIKDPIEALIALEKLKSEKNPYSSMYPMLAIYTVFGGLFALFGWILDIITNPL